MPEAVVVGNSVRVCVGVYAHACVCVCVHACVCALGAKVEGNTRWCWAEAQLAGIKEARAVRLVVKQVMGKP